MAGLPTWIQLSAPELTRSTGAPDRRHRYRPGRLLLPLIISPFAWSREGNTLNTLKSVMSQEIVAVLHPRIGDASGCLRGDTSAPRVRWLSVNPLILVSGSRSRSGL